MAFRAVVSVVILVCFGCSALYVGCDQIHAKQAAPKLAERVSVAPGYLASGKHCFSLNVRFVSAKPSAAKDEPARLGYLVSDNKNDSKTMELSDPEHPHGALEVYDACEVDMQPRLSHAVVTSENGQECRAETTYWFELHTSEKEPVADFTIDENANLSIVTGSVRKPFKVQLVSTRGRSVYIVYRVAPVTAKSTPLFAFEWLPDEVYSTHSVKAADGWRYEFRGHSGTLGFFHAACMGTLPDDLALVATTEQNDSLAELRAWAAAPRPCGG